MADVLCTFFKFKAREMRPSENFSFSIYPEKHVPQPLETRAMLEPSQEHVMFFYRELGTGSGLCQVFG